METQENLVDVQNGWGVLGLLIVTFALWVSGLVWFALGENVPAIIAISILIALWSFCCAGFYTLQPNQAAVLILFGKYAGTDKSSGFRWANPFYKKTKISQRARNLNMHPIKVNDLRGNPIEIAAAVVWNVDNTAQAVFDVEKFDEYVSVQSESALRHLTMAYPYDDYRHEVISLRGSTDEVSDRLQKEIQARMAMAGVQIVEAKLSHLAYSQEIAGAMLQRQQAEAIVAARSRIVDGAVGMVEMALQKLEESKTVTLDEDRKAAMVGNLLVVLCGRADAQPVINTGTLYQ